MSAEQGTRASEPDRLEEAAQWWVVLLEGELPVELKDAWDRWKAVPENCTAFGEISNLTRGLKAVGHPPTPTQAALDGDRYTGSVPVSTWLNCDVLARERQGRVESGLVGENREPTAIVVRRAADYHFRR